MQLSRNGSKQSAKGCREGGSFVTDRVVALAKWRKAELVMACLSLTVCRGTQQGSCSTAGPRICASRSTHDTRDTN